MLECIGCRIQKNFHGNALMTLLSDVNLAIQSITAKLYDSFDCTWNTAGDQPEYGPVVVR